MPEVGYAFAPVPPAPSGFRRIAVPDSEPESRAARVARARFRTCEPPRDLATCHRDLWADNVLPTQGGGLCVID